MASSGDLPPRGEFRVPRQQPDERPIQRRPGMDWQVGQALLQGFVGWSAFTDVEVDGGTTDVDGDSGDLDSIPLIGGGGQFKLGGERLDFGLEGLLSLGGRANATAFAAGGGGAAVAVDVDLLLFELYGGPFASMFLGEKLRVYAAGGPLMQFAEYDQQGGTFDNDGSGFGAGFYARTGLEFVLPSRTLVGFGVRWSDSSVDLSGGLGDLEIQGLEALITVSVGL
ncbi:MAG: hypothetical protein EYC70_12200 [Planctomycetota bacterium]|nr:MAG: hypothetical protein EYC70_12200 [Planctomycetota bacterium]